MDIYNTVWLSDYESVKSFGSQSGISSLNQSKMLETFVNDVCHSSPKMSAGEFLHQTGWCRTCSRKCAPKNYLRRTLSLPELDFNELRPSDLQDRFSQLQLEQENTELRLLVDQLQNALETIEQSMNHNMKGLQIPPPKNTYSNNNNKQQQQQQQPGDPALKSQSMDSLDEMYSHAMGEGKDTSRNNQNNESGYNSTFQDNSNLEDGGKDVDDGGNKLSRKELSKKERFSDYDSDGSCGSGSEAFYESRLNRKQRFDGDDTNCCVIH